MTHSIDQQRFNGTNCMEHQKMHALVLDKPTMKVKTYSGKRGHGEQNKHSPLWLSISVAVQGNICTKTRRKTSTLRSVLYNPYTADSDEQDDMHSLGPSEGLHDFLYFVWEAVPEPSAPLRYGASWSHVIRPDQLLDGKGHAILEQRTHATLHNTLISLIVIIFLPTVQTWSLHSYQLN